MDVENVLLEFSAGDTLGNLVYSANRYSPPDSCEEGVTLVFAHAASAHKEQWDVTIRSLAVLSNAHSSRSSSSLKLREMWALDFITHGETALLNRDRIQLAGEAAVGVEIYAALLSSFIHSSALAGRRRVIAIGHSASSSAWILALRSILEAKGHEDEPALASLILIEPVLILPLLPDPPEVVIDASDPRVQKGPQNVGVIRARRNAWPDLQAAEAWHRGKAPWKRWDNRILSIFFKHALHVVSSHSEPNPNTTSNPSGLASSTQAPAPTHVETKASPLHESQLYAHPEHVAAGRVFPAICQRIKVHVVFGERGAREMVSKESRSAVLGVEWKVGATGPDPGRTASVRVVDGAGHLAVQENPEGVAHAIWDVLCSSNALSPPYASSLDEKALERQYKASTKARL